MRQWGLLSQQVPPVGKAGKGCVATGAASSDAQALGIHFALLGQVLGRIAAVIHIYHAPVAPQPIPVLPAKARGAPVVDVRQRVAWTRPLQNVKGHWIRACGASSFLSTYCFIARERQAITTACIVPPDSAWGSRNEAAETVLTEFSQGPAYAACVAAWQVGAGQVRSRRQMRCQVQSPSAAGVQHTAHTGCMHLHPSPTSQTMAGESRKQADEVYALC